MTDPGRLILASASPRRRELLASLDVPFDVIVSPYREPQLPPAAMTPRALAEALAYFKARSVAERHRQRFVLGADTLVSCNGEVLGKPCDADDARRMLELQARHPSEVITGVALVRECPVEGAHCRMLSERTRVLMRDDPQAREQYLASGEWQGKAGAYGVQDVGDTLVLRLDGSFSNAVGLPLERVRRMLEAIFPGVPA